MKRNLRYYVFCCFLLSSFAATGEGLIDPTRPPTYQDSVSSKAQYTDNFILSAVLISPQRRLAIINGQQVMVGDKLGEFTITSISSNTVELIGPENRKQLLQLAAPVKKPR